MADIVVSSKKKINLFDRVIQSVVIAVNMNKMNRAIDEHLSVIRKTEGEDQKIYQENILREIVFVKYQYDIMQREMYELKLSYPNDILEKINSTDKIDRLELQKAFLEMEYDRITKAKFKSREDIKFGLFAISSAIDEVKQNIKDEGKSQRYNNVIKSSEEIDTKIRMWPNARICVMGGEQAAGVLATVRRDGIEARGGTWSAEEEARFKQPILDQFAHQSHPYYASARLWDDGVIDPADTRRVLALGLSASLNAPIGEPRFGVFRM